jgi:hypothetical protein
MCNNTDYENCFVDSSGEVSVHAPFSSYVEKGQQGSCEVPLNFEITSETKCRSYKCDKEGLVVTCGGGEKSLGYICRSTGKALECESVSTYGRKTYYCCRKDNKLVWQTTPCS